MKRAVGIAGVLVVVAGFGVVAGGDRAAGLSTSRFLIVVVGLFCLLVGLWILLDRRFSDAERATPPDRERGHRVTVPGDAFDRAVARGESSGGVRPRLAERVRVSLEERGMSREEAVEVVEHGAWTDDPVAAAYLSTTAGSVPLSTRLRWLVRGDSPVERSVARTVAALAALREGSGGE